MQLILDTTVRAAYGLKLHTEFDFLKFFDQEEPVCRGSRQ
jgi:hypothetical protein